MAHGVALFSRPKIFSKEIYFSTKEYNNHDCQMTMIAKWQRRWTWASQGIDGGPPFFFLFFFFRQRWRCNLSFFPKCLWQWRFNLKVLPKPLSQVWQWWFNLSLFPRVANGSDGLTLKFNLSLFLKCGNDGLTWASFPKCCSDGEPEPLGTDGEPDPQFLSGAVTVNLSLSRHWRWTEPQFLLIFLFWLSFWFLAFLAFFFFKGKESPM